MATEQSWARAAPFEFPAQVFASASALLGAAAQRGQALVAGSLKSLEAETSRYLEELSTDNREALDALAKCKGPVEVLAAEQKWLAARTQACLETSLRMSRAFTDALKTEAKKPEPPTLEVVPSIRVAEEGAVAGEAEAAGPHDAPAGEGLELADAEETDPIRAAHERLRRTVDRLS